MYDNEKSKTDRGFFNMYCLVLVIISIVIVGVVSFV